MRTKSFFAIALMPGLLLSCKKGIPSDSDSGSGSRISNLISITWAIKSANSIDSLSTGTRHHYLGTTADTLNFLWGASNQVYVYGISGAINSVAIQSNILKITPAAIISPADTGTIAYDTIICATKFRPNYSDSLFVTKVSQQNFVFRIRYMDSFGKGVEIDSLDRLRYR